MGTIGELRVSQSHALMIVVVSLALKSRVKPISMSVVHLVGVEADHGRHLNLLLRLGHRSLLEIIGRKHGRLMVWLLHRGSSDLFFRFMGNRAVQSDFAHRVVLQSLHGTIRTLGLEVVNKPIPALTMLLLDNRMLFNSNVSYNSKGRKDFTKNLLGN